jgi:hypothetical protein
MTVSRQLHKWRAEGTAEVRGPAGRRSWHLTGQGTARHTAPGDEQRDSAVTEVDADQVRGPGEFSIEQVVIMTAFWALKDGAGPATRTARVMGMPDADLARALRLAEQDPGHVKAEARRILLQGGAPAPDWLGEDTPVSDAQ